VLCWRFTGKLQRRRLVVGGFERVWLIGDPGSRQAYRSETGDASKWRRAEGVTSSEYVCLSVKSAIFSVA
jgi:hypothetical protein